MNTHGFPCAVIADLNRYLTQLDEDERWQETVDARQEKLLGDGGNCYPFSTDNLSQAICESDIKTIATALKARKHEEAGKALAALVNAYWEREARRWAEREIENERANACTCCRGCRYCNED